jgi:U3 small nucleolar RNA-associated protein 10
MDGRVLYEKRLQDHWIPCILQVSMVSRQENFWKLLHHQLLLKTRHKNPSIRWGALQAVQALYRHWGEEFLILLPEAIPFLAELMEDDDISVEAGCQETIAVIESHLGESLQKYLH